MYILFLSNYNFFYFSISLNDNAFFYLLSAYLNFNYSLLFFFSVSRMDLKCDYQQFYLDLIIKMHLMQHHYDFISPIFLHD
jgi:hypothetical protein